MWSKKYKECIVCRTTERKHCGKGMCEKCRARKYRKENPKIFKRISIKYREVNREKINERSRNYKKENPENFKKYYKKNSKKIKEKNEKWQKENPRKYKKYQKSYRKNSEKYKEYQKDHKKKNFEKNKEYHRNYQYNRRQIDPRYKLRCNVSTLVSEKLRKRLSSKRGKSTWNFLSYTINELMQHLEGLFTEGMTWENYGEWHIDHITPDCSFNYNSVEDKEFQECWALKNLQPLWAIDNIRKGSRICNINNES